MTGSRNASPGSRSSFSGPSIWRRTCRSLFSIWVSSDERATAGERPRLAARVLRRKAVPEKARRSDLMGDLKEKPRMPERQSESMPQAGKLGGDRPNSVGTEMEHGKGQSWGESKE